MNKPPLGIKPKHVHDAERGKEIILAAARYMDAGVSVPREWFNELKELLPAVAKTEEEKAQPALI